MFEDQVQLPKYATDYIQTDEYVSNKRGIFEYILGGELDKSLLSVRIFDERTKRAKYALQTEEAKAAGHSNCPYCAMSDNANRTRIWKLTEMDADHVTAWSNGGATDISNCEMLCKSHNRAKGNRQYLHSTLKRGMQIEQLSCADSYHHL